MLCLYALKISTQKPLNWGNGNQRSSGAEMDRRAADLESCKKNPRDGNRKGKDSGCKGKDARALRAQLAEQARQKADLDKGSAALQVELDSYGGPARAAAIELDAAKKTIADLQGAREAES